MKKGDKDRLLTDSGMGLLRLTGDLRHRKFSQYIGKLWKSLLHGVDDAELKKKR